MKPITYIHSRLTLSRYNTWRFIWCCVHLPGPVPPLKQRTIEWLVDMFFQTYGRTHDGTPRGFPLHRADARSALARHALWLRAQLYDQKLISRVVWDHWCDVEIPALRQEAARNGFTFGHLPALPGDPEGRSHIKEVPDDPTNERLDDRQKTREDRLRAPARRRASRRTRSSSPPSDRTHVRRRITRISDDEVCTCSFTAMLLTHVHNCFRIYRERKPRTCRWMTMIKATTTVLTQARITTSRTTIGLFGTGSCA